MRFVVALIKFSMRRVADAMDLYDWYRRELADKAHPSTFPPPVPDFEGDITPTLRCRHTVRLNQRCLDCDPPDPPFTHGGRR